MGGVQKYEDEKETIRKSIEQNVELGLVKRTLQRIIMLRHVGYVSMTTNDLRRLNVFLFRHLFTYCLIIVSFVR